MAMNQARYDKQIDDAALRMGNMDPNISAEAFLEKLTGIAKLGQDDELTISMMTIAAAKVATRKALPSHDVFVAQWNLLFPNAEMVDGFAAPCLIKIGDKRGMVAAAWSTFLANPLAEFINPETVQ